MDSLLVEKKIHQLLTDKKQLLQDDFIFVIFKFIILNISLFVNIIIVTSEYT